MILRTILIVPALALMATSAFAQQGPGGEPSRERPPQEEQMQRAPEGDRGPGGREHEDRRGGHEGPHGERGTRMFDRVDMDGNGEVDADEIAEWKAEAEARALRRIQRIARMPERVERRMERADADGDGVVTREEFMEAAHEHGPRGEGRGRGGSEERRGDGEMRGGEDRRERMEERRDRMRERLEQLEERLEELESRG